MRRARSRTGTARQVFMVDAGCQRYADFPGSERSTFYDLGEQISSTGFVEATLNSE